MHTSNTGAIRRLASVAATSLVIASASFGGIYAYRVGSEVSTLLGIITILFAVSLELLKPLSIAAAFQACSIWSIGRGLALGLLGVVAVAYSLVAEISLVSMSRGDLAAGRAARAAQTTVQAGRVKAARDELATIPAATRSPGELQALTQGMHCDDCRSLIRLKAELARAQRKAELEATISAAAQPASAGQQSVGQADPGAANLSMYLASLGISVSSDTVAKWLALIPTLAIELGSALSLVLLNSLHTQQSTQTITQHSQTQHNQEVSGRVINGSTNVGPVLKSTRHNSEPPRGIAGLISQVKKACQPDRKSVV